MKVHASFLFNSVISGMMQVALARSVHFLKTTTGTKILECYKYATARPSHYNTATVTIIPGSHRYATARPSTIQEASIAHVAAQPDNEPVSSTPHGPWTRSSSDSVSSATVTSKSTDWSATASPTTSDSSVPMSTDIPLKACWASTDCLNAINDFTSSWDVTGINLTNGLDRGPDGFNEAGSAFAVYFCKVKHYEDILVNGTVGLATPLGHCTNCFMQAGINLNSPQHREAVVLTRDIDTFCHTDKPNLFNLLEDLVSFMRSLSAPEKFNNTPLPLTAVVASLTSYYLTRSNSSDQRPSSTSDQHTSSSSWWQTRLTPGKPIPTQYLAQLPLNWPYTAYNRAGKITSWSFVNPNATSETVAWLYHSMLHNPRPVFTPKAHKLEVMYNPALTNWKHSFMHDTTPAPSTTRDASQPQSSPTITQSAVLSLDHDTDEQRRSQDGSGTKPAAAGPEGSSATALSNLLSQVASMKSALDMRLHWIG